MIYLFIKFIINIYIYLYIFYVKYIYYIKYTITWGVYFYNLLNIILNVYIFFYFNNFFLYNKIIEIYIEILYILNYIIVELILKIVKIIKDLFNFDLLNYSFIYLNKFKLFNIILQYLIIKLYLFVLVKDLFIHKRYYKGYSLYWYTKFRTYIYCKYLEFIVYIDRRAYYIICYIVLYFYYIFNKILTKYKNKRKYWLLLIYWSIKFINWVKDIYDYYMCIYKETKYIMDMYIFSFYEYMLSLYFKNNIFFLIFLYLINIIEYIYYYKYILFKIIQNNKG